jgi:excisionase family DNA binding protein
MGNDRTDAGIIAQSDILLNTLSLSTDFHGPRVQLDDWISQAEAARLRGVSRQAIARLVQHGRLATLTVGGRRFVRRRDVLAFEPLPAGRPRSRSDG